MPIHLRITTVQNFDDHIGHLVATMKIIRQTTLNVLGNLTVRQLDYLHDEKSNSIGTILKHICALETHYRIINFEKREMTEKENNLISPFLADNLLHNQLKGNELTYYLKALEGVREKTLEVLKTKKDDWLYEDMDVMNGEAVLNNYYLLFHLIEDEINHKAQIKWIMNRFPNDL